tara:strand:+ start:91 stop:291 length:201 start_codon:yes stop_codon:yes gene_type:complete
MNPIPNHCIECDKPTMNILCDKCKEEEDPMTNCCSSPFLHPGWPDSDLCSKCYEHADTWEEDDEQD